MNKYYRLIRYDWPYHFFYLITNWLPDNVLFLKLRGFLISFFIKSAGKNFQIGRDVTIYNPSNFIVGDNVYIAKGCWFSCGDIIKIGNNILFGPYVTVVTSNHSLSKKGYYFGKPINIKRVIIKDGSWIGAQCTILSGCIVEKNVLLAANSVLKGNTEIMGIYAGIPARLIKFAKYENE